MQHFIVSREGILFLMRADDFRLSDAKFGYVKETPATMYKKDRKQMDNGRCAFKAVGTNGKAYRVFPDYSARIV